jgi:hypothetical protein
MNYQLQQALFIHVVMCSRQKEGGSKPHVRLADEHGTYLGVCERASPRGGWLCSEGLTIAHNVSSVCDVRRANAHT